MAISLNTQQFVNSNRTPLTYPPQIVAFEIHEHDVFGSFLGIGDQVLRQLKILSWGGSTRSRSSNWSCLSLTCDELHQPFGRTANYATPRRLPIASKRRRIDLLQGAINLPAVSSCMSLKPEGKISLKDIPSLNILFGAAYICFVIRLGGEEVGRG